MTEHIRELTPIDSETWETTIGVEVVRCRDCRWCVKKGYRLYCELNAGGFPEVEPDGFCAWGERTEDERMEERTKTEQNGAGITEELRKWNTGRLRPDHAGALDAISDRIDERYHRDMATAQQVGINEGEDAAMREGWVRLPVDADGEFIHIGDVMIKPDGYDNRLFTVDGMTLYGDHWSVRGFVPHNLRHHHPTAEDVLRELIHRYDELRLGPSAFDPFELTAEYAAKLRLAGDAE